MTKQEMSRKVEPHVKATLKDLSNGNDLIRKGAFNELMGMRTMCHALAIWDQWAIIENALREYVHEPVCGPEEDYWRRKERLTI